MRVIVVDDDQLVEMSLTTILGSDEEIDVVGSGHDGTEAVALYKKEKPDVVLMDIQMQKMSGLAAAEEILTMDKAAKILLLTTFSDEEYIVKALGLGCTESGLRRTKCIWRRGGIQDPGTYGCKA